MAPQQGTGSTGHQDHFLEKPEARGGYAQVGKPSRIREVGTLALPVQIPGATWEGAAGTAGGWERTPGWRRRLERGHPRGQVEQATGEGTSAGPRGRGARVWTLGWDAARAPCGRYTD